jgi:hypothetical protein
MSAMLLLKDGDVIDGTGSPQRRADVLISGESIVEIGEFKHPPHFAGSIAPDSSSPPASSTATAIPCRVSQRKWLAIADFQRIRVRPIAANRSGMPTESSAAPASGAGTQPVGTLALFGYE